MLRIVANLLCYECSSNYHQLIYKNISCAGVVSDYIYNSYQTHPHEYTIAVNAVTVEQQPQHCKCTIVVHAKEKGAIQIGDSIELNNIRIRPITNESRWFSFLRHGILTHDYREKFLPIVLSSSRYSFNRACVTMRNKILASLEENLAPETFALCTALFFGKKLGDPNIHEQLQRSYTQWGIVHYLARSGLHVAVLILMWRACVTLVPLSLVMREILLLLALLLYASLTWATISFNRAFIMFILQQIARIAMLPHHNLYGFCLTALLIVLYNPLELCALDFQLSFILTGALLIYFSQSTRRANP